MRTAVISDIHGNLDALECVLETADQLSADRVACLGDIVGYGPQPAECIRLIQEQAHAVVAGNHDLAVANTIDIANFNVLAREATLWTRENLDEAALAYLSDLPLVVELDGFTLVHGTLHSPELFDYVQTSYDAHLSMQKMQQPLCCIGHSHVPIAFQRQEVVTYCLDPVVSIDEDSRTIVNVGSVGQPRDHDPRSSFIIFDAEASRVEFHRTRYDVDATATKIHQAGLPRPLGDRLAVGR